MKVFFVAAMSAALFFTSCVSRSTADRIEGQRDSLTMVVSAKDSLINAVFEDINSISENLSMIKTRENLITAAGNADGVRRPVAEINNDIAAIDNLLQENKAKIASLQRAAAKLRKANLRIEGLEKMVAGLNKQLDQKTNEIVALQENLSRMGVKVEALSQQVAERGEQVENLSSEKTQLENQMNTVHYIVGSEKELRDAQIVTKKGFIGRTLTVNKDANFDSFTKADSRLLSEIALGYKKVTIVTVHPEGSYELVTGADKVVSKLLILDPVRFWETSKVLVVSYK